MKKMKTKRFLSLLLALAMSFSLAVPAFAAEPYGDPSAEIKPRLQLCPHEPISWSSGNSVGPFTTSPNSGKYLRVWFRNYSGAEVTVILMDGTNSIRVPLKFMIVGSDSGQQGRFVYEIPNPDVPHTFYIRFDGRNSARIVGEIAAAQYTYDPSNPS